MEEHNGSLSDRAKKDLELVEAAIGGDQKAYAQLMANYRETIFFMLLKMVKNRDDADDLTIEAFGKAFKRLDQYKPEFAFSTWLFRIATNNCIDFIRKQKKAQTYSLDSAYTDDDGNDMHIDVKSKALNPEEFLVKGQRIDELRKVVAELKPKYRQLVEMRYFQELSYEEIAEELDIPLGTVKAQLFRARELLQQVLKHQVDHL